MTAGNRARYLIVSPCRNEAAHMRETLDSVIAQRRRPDLWVIVDDGSSDETPEILRDYAGRHDWIRVVRRDDRGHRSVGPGVIDAFYAGLETVRLRDFDYLCKLDLDLRLPSTYFEELIRRCERNPRIGTCSGKAYMELPDGSRRSEGIGDEMSVGASKFYRVSCFEEIGGFVREVMWDGIDCHRCRMLGWLARSWDDERLNFVHLRPMGSSDRGILRGRYRHGFGQYYMGSDPLFVIASAVYRTARPPYVIGGLASAWGYVDSALRGRKRYGDEAFRRFLRRYQRRALLKGKTRAIAEIDARQLAPWRHDHPDVDVDDRLLQ